MAEIRVERKANTGWIWLVIALLVITAAAIAYYLWWSGYLDQPGTTQTAPVGAMIAPLVDLMQRVA
jgi:flagellar basal body-associated protein FliL